MQLPNSLNIDFENSGEFYEGMSINIQKEAAKNGESLLVTLGKVKTLLEEEIKKNGKSPYDFGIIDSATALDDLSVEFGTMKYKKTLAGKSYAGTDVTRDLANGNGFFWSREAFEALLYPFLPLFNKCLILVVHIKDKDINLPENTTINVKELNLTGKLKLILPAKADGIAKLFRRDGQNILSFKSIDENNIALGLREKKPRLNQNEYVISEVIDGELRTYWSEIFPSIKKK